MVSASLFVAFDMLTLLISMADVITDVFVLYQWYMAGQYAFFYASLSILIAANISYFILFTRYFRCDHFDLCFDCYCSPRHGSGWFYYLLLLLGFIFMPLLPYFLFFLESPYICRGFSRVVRQTWGLSRGGRAQHYIPKQLQDELNAMDDANFDLKLKDIFRDKINCHLGFMLETFIESFPQSIIQMVAILQLSSGNDSSANLIIVASIFLSLLSIAFKSIMLLAVPDLWTSMFNWIAAVTDFYAVFVILSWLFLEIDGNQTWTQCHNLRWFTLILWICTTLPFTLTFLYFVMFAMFQQTDPRDRARFSACKCCCTALCCLVPLIVLGGITSHIMCCVFIALYVAKFGLTRCTDTKNGEYWAPVFKFIHASANNTDRLVKVCIINKHLDRKNVGQWLDSHADSAYTDIDGFQELRQHLHREHFLKQVVFADTFNSDGQCVESAMSYVLMPCFLCGRAIHLLFPTVIYVSNLWMFGPQGLHLLHHVLNLVFIAFLIIMLAVSYKVLNFTYCIYHIGCRNQAPPLNHSVIEDIGEAYIDLVQLPVIIAFFDDRFGQDVSRLILEYLKSIHLE